MANDDLVNNIVGFPTVTNVQRAYNWDFFLPDLWGILVSGIVVSKYCQSVRLRQYDVGEVVELMKGPFKLHFPNALTIDAIDATYVCPVPDLVVLYFSKWKSLMYDRKGRYQVARNYKRNGYVILYDRSGLPVNVIRLIGLFPVKFPAFDLDYRKEEELRFDVSFRIDRTEMGLRGLTGLGKGVGAAVKGAVKGITGG
jgi:hypothetical protein